MRKTGTVCFKHFKTGNEDINALLIRPHELYLMQAHGYNAPRGSTVGIDDACVGYLV